MAKVIVSPTTGEVYRKRSQLGGICKRFAKNKMAMVGLVIFIFLIIMVLTCDLFFDYQADAIAQDISQRLQAPSAAHPFGTDQYGRDVLARIVYGARISLVASLCIITVSTVLGAMFGSVAAYYGGWIDNIIMRVMDVFYALPFNLMAICIVASIGGGIVNLGIAILAIAGLSYIGLGIESPTPEWGAMLSEGREFMRNYPYLVIFPGLAILVSALSLNLMGDGLRDALDPKLKK